jgi:hypothetical protein
VTGIYRVLGLNRDIAIHDKLPGELLRARHTASTGNPEPSEELLPRFAALLSELHAKGILFRAIHLNNIVVLPDEQLAIIDMVDLHHSWFGSLPPWQRVRNLGHIFRYEEDLHILQGFGIDRFLDAYLNTANMPPWNRWLFRKLFWRSYEELFPKRA